MAVLVLWVVVAVGMGMARAVGMHVFVLMENDLEMSPEGVGNTA